MKIAIVVPFFVCVFTSAAAQTTAPEILPGITAITPVQIPQALWVHVPPAPPQAKLLSVTAAGRLYALPQGNMPCSVPNTPAAAVIPNAAKFVLPGNRIPNASRVYPLIPKR